VPTENNLDPEDADEDALFAKMLSALGTIKRVLKTLVAGYDPPPTPPGRPVALDQRAAIRRDRVYYFTGPPPLRRQRRPPWKQRAPSLALRPRGLSARRIYSPNPRGASRRGQR
jgi:hypothetical protein